MSTADIYEDHPGTTWGAMQSAEFGAGVRDRNVVLIDESSLSTRASDHALRSFVALAGGRSGRIVVVPATTPNPLDCGRHFARALLATGAGLVEVLHIDTRTHADNEHAAELLALATGMLIAGQSQEALEELLEGTRACRMIRARRREGCAMAATRAGMLFITGRADG